jgi:hypothetical protein
MRKTFLFTGLMLLMVAMTAPVSPAEKPPVILEVGVTDTATGKMINQIAFERPADAPTAPWYCASGQTDTKFIPVSMSIKGYLDVWDKAKILAGAGGPDHRVWLDGNVGNVDFGTDYKFFHGINTPDKTKMLLSVNRLGEDGYTGNIDLYYLDMDDLVNGEVNVVQQNRITGTPKTTVTFRQYFTPDGKYLLQSGADTFFLVDAATLETVDQQGDLGGDNHDAFPTPDSKYAILTLRTATDDPKVKDGQLRLYDIEAKELVGRKVSVCKTCHERRGLEFLPETNYKHWIVCKFCHTRFTVPDSAILCGLDGKLQGPAADGTYSGKLWITGHGGHFSEATVKIDPANTGSPIEVLDLKQRDICKNPPCGETHKFHDARIDYDTGKMYWSTYK